MKSPQVKDKRTGVPGTDVMEEGIEIAKHGIVCLVKAVNISLKDDVVSLTDFSRNTREHTRSLDKSQRPRLLTHNGKAAAVVMSVDAFEELAHQAEEYRLDVRLQTALEAYARGKEGKPIEQVFTRLRQQAARRQNVK